VRFKHGIHTIYLFVDSLGPVSEVNKDLRELLQDRYPDGLKISLDSPDKTPIPSKDVAIAYAVLNVPNDPTRGWKRLNIADEKKTTASKAGLKDNGIVAFTFVEDEDDEPVFLVDWPKEDEEMLE
jgi:hypothetical protein